MLLSIRTGMPWEASRRKKYFSLSVFLFALVKLRFITPLKETAAQPKWRNGVLHKQQSASSTWDCISGGNFISPRFDRMVV